MRKKRDRNAEELLALNREAAVEEYDFLAQLIATPPPAQPAPRVFVSYAAEDRPRVRRLHSRLRAAGHNPWMDVVDLLPGADWRSAIEEALHGSAVAVLCLSRASVTKTGFVQAEARQVLAFAEERPFGRIGVIPARLEDCSIPTPLRRYHCVDLFRRGGFARLTETLRQLTHAERD